MTMIPAFLLQDDGSSAVATGAMAGLGIGFFLVMIVIAVVFIIGYWKVFEKAGQPGWAAIIPIYNAYILTQIAGRCQTPRSARKTSRYRWRAAARSRH